MHKVSINFVSIINLLLIFFACFYIFSGVLKILNPTQVLSSVELLVKKLLSFDLSLGLLLLFMSIIIIWEILLGVLFILRIKVDKVLWAFLLTNLSFTVVSHYLAYLNKLETCGCFGSFSSQFHPYHFILLYSFNVALILAIFFSKQRKYLFRF